MSNSRQTSGRLDGSIRNLMLYPFELRAQTDDCNQSDSVQASRIPTRNDYLRAKIWYVLCNIDHIVPRKAREKVQDRLWSLWRELRDSKGFGNWWALIFAGGTLGLLALIVFTHLPKLYVYQYPSDTFQIVQKIDPFHYRMRRVHSGLDSFSREFTTTFCSNYPLAFSAGETLIWLAYEDKGCWDVSGKELGYLFLRDDKGNVILAPNCYWKDDVLAECKGEPKW